MSLEKIFDAIESYEFSARINVASSVDSFLITLTSDDAFHLLVAKINDDLDFGPSIVERIRQLANLQIDVSYSNRYDTALCAYSWALLEDTRTFELARIGAELMAAAPRVWWSIKISEKILSRQTASVGSNTTIDFVDDVVIVRTRDEGSSQYEHAVFGQVAWATENPSFLADMTDEPSQTLTPPRIIIEPRGDGNLRSFINT